ncbi:HlyD family secretion protein [Chitinimonas koreensis]|uniref:HlyD family secretion protein n=1 Tax=Chitinimonas koreensis TaxID=356302 RepID=UPI000423E20D|nr:HlyD family efflux transporter periplasmic adaptor subunit [Chitinimonas koreensis]QNM95660.1 HlyD family efflux transporter periplasmic adaptor subunit [Chitinimonas koreensis]
MTTPTQTQAPAAENGRRKPLLLALAGAFGLAAVAYGVYWYSHGRYYVETDNAYVAGNVVQVTPQTAGTIVAIAADDTDFVEAGQPLVVLDAADAQLALETAEVQLGQTVRETRTLYANDGTLRATVTLREADLARAKQDLQRRQALAGTGAVAGEEIQHARDALKAAEAGVQAAREQLAANQALIARTTPKSHPNVQRAALKVKEAQLALSRTTVPAPVSGFVARRAAQPGQRVGVGAPLMAVVPLDQLWVDANFKESQLRDMRMGQPVTLRADVYGDEVVYHGKVAGFAAGTGAAFSLLPAQNATGNWIKVVQRLPVRIALDAKEIAEHPLRVGLSMRAEVETHDKSGPQLASVRRTAPVAETRVFDGLIKTAAGKAAAVLNAEAGQ